MGVNRLNPVQKATYVKKKQKWEKMKNVQSLSKKLQTSDHRFRAISGLISAASPEKWIGMPSYEPPRGQ